MIAQENVPGDQLRMAERWGMDCMVGCYISSLPLDAMKSLAGFATNRLMNYFLPRAVIAPPEELLAQIFPDVEYWLSKF
ncbi:hypothetical protein [Parasitella parasitica]|uniref:Ndc10 domain-containing protein n=1 Tax=Parasitella parasitica TaxID=35722 RepID=A0A0B7N575_9FUNG|nr:hypothetical protein [Parasitella parasitica]